MAYAIATLYLLITWFNPAIGIVLQGPWLILVFVLVERHRNLVWLSFPTLILVYLICEIRMTGPEALLYFLNLPYSLISIAIAVRMRRQIPWWLTLVLTSPFLILLMLAAVVWAFESMFH